MFQYYGVLVLLQINAQCKITCVCVLTMKLVTINRFYLKSVFKKCLSLGAYFWLLFLPAWVLFLILQVNLDDPSLANFPPPLPPVESFFDAHALGFVVVWILFQAVLYVLPVGKVSNTMVVQ